MNARMVVTHAIRTRFALIVMEHFLANAMLVIQAMDLNARILTSVLCQCTTVTKMQHVSILMVTSNVVVTLVMRAMVFLVSMSMNVPTKITVAPNSLPVQTMTDPFYANANLDSLVMGSLVMISMSVTNLLATIMLHVLTPLVVIHAHVIPVLLVMV